MTTLHLICGLPCAGKTTLAKQLEQALPALRLTPDEWHLRLFGADFDEASIDERHDDRHNKVEALMWEVAARVLTLGINVILDFGVWAREERDDFRARATQLGAGFQLHFLDVPDDVLLARLAARNASLPPGTFAIPEAKLKEWIIVFQRPTADELAESL